MTSYSAETGVRFVVENMGNAARGLTVKIYPIALHFVAVSGKALKKLLILWEVVISCASTKRQTIR